MVRYFVCDCDFFIAWNGLCGSLWKCSHGAICSVCDAFMCVMSHMNGFYSHSV